MAEGDPGITREMYNELVKRLEKVEHCTRRMECFIMGLVNIFDHESTKRKLDLLRWYFMDPDRAEKHALDSLELIANFGDPDSDLNEIERVSDFLHFLDDILFIKNGESNFSRCYELWQNMKKIHKYDNKRNKS